MSVRQLSVFLENKAGRIAEVTRTLGKVGVNIRAILIADTAEFGILRFVPDDPDKAQEVLKASGFMAKVTEVMAVEIEDAPGRLSEVLSMFNQNKINIEYLYASLERKEGKAAIIFKVADIESCAAKLADAGIKILDMTDMAGL